MAGNRCHVRPEGDGRLLNVISRTADVVLDGVGRLGGPRVSSPSAAVVLAECWWDGRPQVGEYAFWFDRELGWVYFEPPRTGSGIRLWTKQGYREFPKPKTKESSLQKEFNVNESGDLKPSALQTTRSAESAFAKHIVIAAAPDAVFQRVNSMDKAKAWTAWTKNDSGVELRADGPSVGVGTRLVWTGQTHGFHEITASTPFSAVQMRLGLGGRELNSVLELEGVGGGYQGNVEDVERRCNC